MRNFVFYLGLGLLFTHEMDAMTNHEWRLLPLLDRLPDAIGESVFLIVHAPLFALIVAFVASPVDKTRRFAEKIISGFLILHAVAHFALSGHSRYEFSSTMSSVIIYAAALCGVAHILTLQVGARARLRE